MKKNPKIYFVLLPVLLMVNGCKSSNIYSPMDNAQVLNFGYATILEIINDDLFFSDREFATLPQAYRNNYLWHKDASDPEGFLKAYRVVYEANEALKELADRKTKYADMKGRAYFFRAFAYYTIAQLYCLPYDARNLKQPGIPLTSGGYYCRSNVDETYQQIIDDLHHAVHLLDDRNLRREGTISKLSPSKTAAFAMLSRAYLVMQDYPNAERYADSCLIRYHALYDYNYPIIKIFSQRDPSICYEEIIFYGTGKVSGGLVNPTLYQSYDQNDLRKRDNFKIKRRVPQLTPCYNPYNFSSDYKICDCINPNHSHEPDRTPQFFYGLATDEIFLNRAEARIRNGKTRSGLDDLNTLLITRYRKGSFKPYRPENMDRDSAIRLVLQERRKSLVYRGLRWSDVRRLNCEGKYPVTLKKQVDGKVYTLTPNDLRYVLLLPPVMINENYFRQNPR